MNKLVIPAILVVTVMVAGMFAFMPVEQASTVHDSVIDTLAGANVVRISTDIDDGADDLYDGTVTFSRTTGSGVFQIEALYGCDFEIGPDGADFLSIGFTVEGGVLISGQGDFIATAIEGTDLVNADECVYLLYDGDNQQAAIPHSLFGDENNDVVLDLDESDGTPDNDADGATIVAYVSGLSSASDLEVISTTDDN